LRVYAVDVLKRLRASRLLRAVLLYGTIVFCAYGMYVEWPQVRSALGLVHWYAVFEAALAAIAGSACMTLAWRDLVGDLGSRVQVPAAFRIMSVTNLAKYLPGGVWALAAQIELGHDYEVPRRRGATAVVVCLALTLAVALATAAAVLPLASAKAAREYWWALAITPVILVCLWPPLMGWLLDKALSMAKRAPLERRPSTAGLLRALGWNVAGWLLWGIQAWVLVRDLTGHGMEDLLIAIGGYALAWTAGVLIIFAPGGVGAREIALMAVLAPIMPRGSALAVALVSLAVMTLSDVLFGAIGVAVARLAPPTAESARARRGRHRKPRRQMVPVPAWLLASSGAHARP
jgi:glycosyltransferase 2 family protein